MVIRPCGGAVVLGNLRLVSVYQPVLVAIEEAMERCRKDLKSQVGIDGREASYWGRF